MWVRTVGTYSLGNLFVVYDINKQVWPRERSLTTHGATNKEITHFTNSPIAYHHTLDCLHFEREGLTEAGEIIALNRPQTR
jgi:hypothetical protein